MQTRWCSVCARETVFVAPGCVDGHEDCPELLCEMCGDAILVGVPLHAAMVPAVAA